MNQTPDAWDDDFSSRADKLSGPVPDTSAPPKVPAKVSKAQRRAQQQALNKQLWTEAEEDKATNYFLESRNVVPLTSTFKPQPILLSRKGPAKSTSSGKTLADGVGGLSLNQQDESSEDDETTAKKLTPAEIAAQAAKEREIKQRRYEERRQELFGTTQSTTKQQPHRSGNSSPKDLTPPHSRSSTPNRGRGRGGNSNGRGRGGGNSNFSVQPRPQLYEPSYSPKPDSAYVQRQEAGLPKMLKVHEVYPIRAPKGPDGSGPNGHGFALKTNPDRDTAQEASSALAAP